MKKRSLEKRERKRISKQDKEKKKSKEDWKGSLEQESWRREWKRNTEKEKQVNRKKVGKEIKEGEKKSIVE